MLLCLALEELVHALGSNLVYVLNHAHAVAFTVTLVEARQVFAGHRFLALAAGLDLVFS